MTYHLFFAARPGQPPPQSGAIRQYFAERRHYRVTNYDAVYHHEDTGVNFRFDFARPRRRRRAEDGKLGPAAWLTFALEYFRPHVFALEAAAEVAAVVKEFELLADDPHPDGMGQGKFSEAGFLAGWNAGNRVVTGRLLAAEDAPKPAVLPAKEIEKFWRWNLAKDALQDELGQALYVPRIMFLRHKKQVASYVLWPDVVPILVPKVDFLVLQRDKVPAKSFPPEPGMLNLAQVPWQDFLASGIKRRTLPGKKDCVAVDYVALPEKLITWFGSARAMKEEIDAVPTEEVLDAELVEECRPARKSPTKRGIKPQAKKPKLTPSKGARKAVSPKRKRRAQR